jgi:hypothetical protein
MQRTQSFVRKRSASPGHRVSFCQHDYVRSSAAGLSSHCEWQSFCIVFCRSHQRHDAEHFGHEQSAVADHDHDCLDLRPRNSEREGQYAERQFGQSWLHERWNQQRPHLDYHLGESEWGKWVGALSGSDSFVGLCGKIDLEVHSKWRNLGSCALYS